MAFGVSATAVPALVNGTTTPSTLEDEEFYDQLLRLRDVVLAGQHAHFKLPQAAIEQLKASLIVPDAGSQLNGAVNGAAFATNQTQLQGTPSLPQFGVPGLHALTTPFVNGAASTYSAKPSSSAGLDPIFLEKSDSLVRAEGQLKRQRLERDLQAQVEQRKHSSRGEKDSGADAPSRIDIDYVLLSALERVKPVSGLVDTGKEDSTSFDENDYYSSQIQSDWSSDASSSKGSDRAAGAFTADFERLDGVAQHASTTFGKRPARASSSKDRPRVYANKPDDVYEVPDEDDEYTPPDATAFDSFREDGAAVMELQQATPPDDDNSEYEPGEITQDSTVPTPQYPTQQPVQPSPRVPVIRNNHLTHIAAPQPNRVSPLATAKGPSLELELVNGRPEMVQKHQQHQNHSMHSRVSTASPSGTGVNGGSGKKRRSKKRKRDQEPAGRAKRRRERQAAVQSPVSPVHQEPYIKDEPMSPPPFANVPESRPYGQQYAQYAPAQIDLVSPRNAQQPQYAHETQVSGLRYEYAQPASPVVVRMASPSAPRPVQRDTQDLRRVASLHYAQRPASPPQQRAYSPVGPYLTASMNYGDPRLAQPAPQREERDSPYNYQEQQVQDPTQYARAERSRSPPRLPEYRDSYAGRAASPALMPPPAPPPRRIVMDQYGNRYYAAEPPPAPAPTPRASMAPNERYAQPEVVYERAPSRMSAAYAQPATQYDVAESRMAPPPPSRRQAAPEQQIEYVDANGYRVREYSSRAVETPRYVEAPTSPLYQPARGYEQMPPPSAVPAREATSPVYIPRTYSVRPEDPQQQVPTGYIRHASVAPMPNARQDAPPPAARAVSMMPSADYGAPQQRTYVQAAAPPSVRYVDQYGNEVFPREVRQVSEVRYQ